MIKILKYLQPYWFLIVVMLVLTYVQVMTSLALPDYMATIINKGVVSEDMQVIRDTGVQMLLVTALGAACTIAVGFLSAKIGTGFSKTIREKVFDKVEMFSLTEFNKFSTASLITRSTNDIQQLQMVVIMVFRMVLSAPIMGIGAVIKANQTAPSMTWIMGVAVAVLLTFIVIIFSIAIPKFTLLQKLVDKLNLVSRENLTGLRVIRAFNAQHYEEHKFDVVNTDLTAVNLFVNRLMVFMQPTMMLIFNITTISIIWVGSHLISNQSLEIGGMMAFMQYAMQVISSFLMISIMFIMIPRASVSGKRVMEVLDTEASIKDPLKPKKRDNKTKGLIEFKDVTFTYPGADMPVLSSISFTAKPGKTTAFVGSTGSGKSTIINLIPRFYDVTSGQVLVDGIDVRDWSQEDLHRIIGYVPQKAILFSGSIKSNITYGAPEMNEEDIEKAAKTAQATEFIQKSENTYNAPIAQGGSNISGGQKQRLSIARALAIKPEVYIFDDSFSALDFKTDAALREALGKETQEATVLIVAQRIGTILDADQIVVLDEGKIVGVGTHKELMKSCLVYKEIALSQLSEKELEHE